MPPKSIPRLNAICIDHFLPTKPSHCGHNVFICQLLRLHADSGISMASLNLLHNVSPRKPALPVEHTRVPSSGMHERGTPVESRGSARALTFSVMIFRIFTHNNDKDGGLRTRPAFLTQPISPRMLSAEAVSS
jgi:hypothetical protein